MKPREFWLKPTATQQLTVFYMPPSDVGIPSIRVREVLPDLKARAVHGIADGMAYANEIGDRQMYADLMSALLAISGPVASTVASPGGES